MQIRPGSHEQRKRKNKDIRKRNASEKSFKLGQKTREISRISPVVEFGLFVSQPKLIKILLKGGFPLGDIVRVKRIFLLSPMLSTRTK